MLKKTGTANLFTMFGEPDVQIKKSADAVIVPLRGVDVYGPDHRRHPQQRHHRDRPWMIDSDYDEEFFFVRHCYFSGGGNDPYQRLKRALRADIDEATWSTLYGTTSRPFPPPSSGKIAVKIINHYGDEVLRQAAQPVNDQDLVVPRHYP